MLNLDQLQNYLDGKDNQHGLSFAATHGFLSATVVGKPLENWLHYLFEGETDTVPQHILTGITAWQASLLADLQQEKTLDLPIDLTNLDLTESDISDWAIGFVDAMYANEHNDWFEQEDSTDNEDVAMLTLPMVIFSGIDENDADLTELRQDTDNLQHMANALSDNLTELYLLFHTPE